MSARLIVSGNRLQLGQNEAGRRIYLKGGEMTHRLTGRAENQAKRQAIADDSQLFP